MALNSSVKERDSLFWPLQISVMHMENMHMENMEKYMQAKHTQKVEQISKLIKYSLNSVLRVRSMVI